MLLSCYINLIKFEKLWLSKILEMTYILERREYNLFESTQTRSISKPNLLNQFQPKPLAE